MATLGELDCIVVLYSGNAKIARIPCNFLLTPKVDLDVLIKNYWADQPQNFYTKITIEYQGKTIYSVDL